MNALFITHFLSALAAFAIFLITTGTHERSRKPPIAHLLFWLYLSLGLSASYFVHVYVEREEIQLAKQLIPMTILLCIVWTTCKIAYIVWRSRKR